MTSHPLIGVAVVGYGLATWNWTVFSGALLLFVTNFITIALTAFGMAKLYGFRNSLSARNTMFQNIALLTVFLALAVPLGFSLQRIAWETNAQRLVRSELRNVFESGSQIDELTIDFVSVPVAVSAPSRSPKPSMVTRAEPSTSTLMVPSGSFSSCSTWARVPTW